jgi:hypothetical protein
MTAIATIAMTDTTANDSLLSNKMSELKHFTSLLAYHVWDNDIPLRNLIKDGNKKVPNTTAIFNMSSAHNCPAKRLGLCKAQKAGVKCYAIKSEVGSRPCVQPYRERQEKFWKEITAESFAVQFLTINALKPIPFNALRLNEAGDFHTQACLDKAEKIARILKRYGIIVYCYTSRNDLDFHNVEALKVSGSGFKKDGIVNIFQIVDSKKDKPKGYKMCPMDCKICTRCLRSGLKTAVLKH